VQASRPQYRAWVFVRPRLAPGYELDRSRPAGSEPRLISPTPEAVEAYEVRYVELRATNLEHPDDPYRAWQDPNTQDQRFEAQDEKQKASIL
jgi:hypothetical protein